MLEGKKVTVFNQSSHWSMILSSGSLYLFGDLESRFVFQPILLLLLFRWTTSSTFSSSLSSAHLQLAQRGWKLWIKKRKKKKLGLIVLDEKRINWKQKQYPVISTAQAYIPPWGFEGFFYCKPIVSSWLILRLIWKKINLIKQLKNDTISA